MNKVYAVMKYEPYEGAYPVKHFEKQCDAEHFADWCNAIEHDQILTMAKKYADPENWIKYAARDDYEVEEFEVIQ